MPNSVINAKTDGLRETGGDAATLDLQISDSTVTSINSTGITVTGSVRTNTYQDASGGNTATINSMTPTADSLQGFRNRIINGGMQIDQRNAGAAITTNGYSVDRFDYANFTDGAFSVQQDTSAPAGFIRSLKVTVTTADASVTTNQSAFISQKIEGLNVSDLGWGASGAKTVTLSFWVRSSLTGTFGGSFRNNATDRSYPFTYSISAANTWEQKTVTVAGDTTGTWLTTNGVGINLSFSLAAGPSVVGTASTWAAANYVSASSTTNVVSTLNATWFITGVQLEVGSTTTPFERRPYGTELMLCQRYYYKTYDMATVPGASGQDETAVYGYGVPNQAAFPVTYPATMRASPTVTAYHPTSGTSGQFGIYNTGSGTFFTVNGTRGSDKMLTELTSSSTVNANMYRVHIVASIEL